MHDETAFLEAIRAHPDDVLLRFVFADWLEERGDSRGELLRLLTTLTQRIEVPRRTELEERLRSLLKSGVQPIGPFFTNSLGMRFSLIWPGTFLMGSPETEEGRKNDETQHRVRLTKPFYLAKYPVTQACWQKVMGVNPSSSPGDQLPVESVSWNDGAEFLQRLSAPEGRTYRFPTEAEWEYACRAGTTTPFSFGRSLNGTEANCNGIQPYGTAEKGPCLGRTCWVGCYDLNAWGLYDMHGNVWEWCADFWSGDAYEESEKEDPENDTVTGWRVLRGGSWHNPSRNCRSACRRRMGPFARPPHLGFRPALRLD
jgi:uncharacterized protein (TIGR02996 family)